jgi:hypothetical protein
MASSANWSIKFHNADPRQRRAVERWLPALRLYVAPVDKGGSQVDRCSTDGAGFQFVAWTRRLAQISTIPPSHPIAISLSPFGRFQRP